MIRPLNILLSVCLWLSILVRAWGNEPPQGPNCIPVKNLDYANLAFKPGETIAYTLHYKWGSINADVAKGHAVLDTLVLNGKPVFHTKVFGRTARFYDIFFKVREDFQSWFTRDGIIPVKFARDSREGSYYSVNVYDYKWQDPEPHIIADLESSRKEAWCDTIPLTGCTYDLPSLFYMARNMDFSRVKPNIKYPMTFVIDEDIYNVYFIWLGRERKYIKGVGTVKTMKFAAKLIAGEVFGSDSDMFLWISEDANRIPVYFEAPIKVGLVSGRIDSWQGLKYPFDALIAPDKK